MQADRTLSPPMTAGGKTSLSKHQSSPWGSCPIARLRDAHHGSLPVWLEEMPTIYGFYLEQRGALPLVPVAKRGSAQHLPSSHLPALPARAELQGPRAIRPALTRAGRHKRWQRALLEGAHPSCTGRSRLLWTCSALPPTMHAPLPRRGFSCPKHQRTATRRAPSRVTVRCPRLPHL